MRSIRPFSRANRMSRDGSIYLKYDFELKGNQCWRNRHVEMTTKYNGWPARKQHVFRINYRHGGKRFSMLLLETWNSKYLDRNNNIYSWWQSVMQQIVFQYERGKRSGRKFFNFYFDIHWRLFGKKVNCIMSLYNRSRIKQRAQNTGKNAH